MIVTHTESFPFFSRCRRVHFVGIGGSGMSGLAELLMNLGYEISGSDMADSETTHRLASMGALIFRGHVPENVRDVDVLVYSSAVTVANPEVATARERNIPVIRRAEMLAELMRMKYGVAVAGTHGKTTTTSLVAAVLAEGGLDPTTIVGGRVNSLGSNARLGTGDYLVAEADESDGTFLKLIPTVAIVTNIDADHLDHYGSFDAVREAFRGFIGKIPFYGFVILCADDENVRALIPQINRKSFTYALEQGADYVAREVKADPEGMTFTAHHGGERLGRLRIGLRGRHNVSNAMAAVATGIELGVEFGSIQKALEEFSGIQRRFEEIGEAHGVTVVDDYGHHPREIRAVLSAARGAWAKRRIFVVFQPHRYTRTQSLLGEFFDAFDEADQLAVLPIYAAGEEPIAEVNAIQICEGVRARGTVEVAFVEGLQAAQEFLLNSVQPGDLVITLGAGDVWKVAPEFLNRLKERPRSVGRNNPTRAVGGEVA